MTKSDNEISDMIVLDINSHKIISEILPNCWPSALGGVRWLPNDSGFTYEYIPVIDKNSKEYLLNVETKLYTLSDKSSTGKTIFSKENNPEIGMKPEDFPEVNFNSKSTDYMFANVSGAASYYDYYYASINDIKKDIIPWKSLYKRKNLVKTFEVVTDDLIFVTAQNAPNFKICKTSLRAPNIDNPETLVKEDPYAVISDIAITNKGLFFVKTINGVSAKLYRLKNNSIEEVPLPKAFGAINLFSKGGNHDNLWIEAKGWTSHKERYHFNNAINQFEREALIPNKPDHNLKNIVVEEIEIPSHDGVMVPLSIIYKKGINKNANNQLLITAYGAYKYVYSPRLNSYLKEWVQNDGIYAVAHVRGGGEKGDNWYKGGFKTTKKNSWKDLIACTDYLIKNNYTSKNKTAVWGGSAGGITVGRAITERPDLYKAAAIRVGLLNMTRLEFGHNGKNNTKEFGTVTDSIELRCLLEMDAYHHIKKGIKYPAVYVTAGMNDSRVPAWQPAKFALKMEDSTSSELPVLLDVDFEGGHGLDASNRKANEELKKIISFLFWQTGHPDYQPEG